MPAFIGSLRLDFGDWQQAGRIAITLEPVTWVSDLTITVPAGYMSDGASVPRPLWWFLPPWGDPGTFAALVHDYLLDRLQGFIPGGPMPGAETRAKCDRQFLLALRALKVPAWKAYAAWAGTRLHSILLFGRNDAPLTAG